MLEMWQALATGLGTNTSLHSEQGKAIVADEVIDKRNGPSSPVFSFLPEMLRAAVPDRAVKLYSVLPMQAVLGIA
jgi:hypothetical protein